MDPSFENSFSQSSNVGGSSSIQDSAESSLHSSSMQCPEHDDSGESSSGDVGFSDEEDELSSDSGNIDDPRPSHDQQNIDSSLSNPVQSSISTAPDFRFIPVQRRRRWKRYLPWLVERDLPAPLLPKSSDDLLIPNNQLMGAIEVYEILRRFSRLLKLSPFLFEDFCAVLAATELSHLISEV